MRLCIKESSESTAESSLSEEDVKESTCTSGRKCVKTHKPKEPREFYKQVFSSDEASVGDEYPSIFQNKMVDEETLSDSPSHISEKDPTPRDEFEDPNDEDVLLDDLDDELVEYLDDDETDDKSETETPLSQKEMFKLFQDWLQGADGSRKRRTCS